MPKRVSLNSKFLRTSLVCRLASLSQNHRQDNNHPQQSAPCANKKPKTAEVELNSAWHSHASCLLSLPSTAVQGGVMNGLTRVSLRFHRSRGFSIWILSVRRGGSHVRPFMTLPCTISILLIRRCGIAPDFLMRRAVPRRWYKSC